MIDSRVLDQMQAAGSLAPEWREAFERVDRRGFIPARAWARDHDGDPFGHVIDRAVDPAEWERYVDGDNPIVTQFNDGEPGEQDFPSSSSSMPSLMAEMLSYLELGPGCRVFEGGTGTGFNAGVMSYRVGADNVFTIDIDPVMCESARSALKQAGFSPSITCGDSTLGLPEHAPYDRVVITYAVRDIAYTWVQQARPGGIIVVPWRSHLKAECLVKLTVGNGGVATGKLLSGTAFMLDRRARYTDDETLSELSGDVEVSTTPVSPAFITEQLDACLYIGTQVRDCLSWTAEEDGRRFLGIEDASTGSWAQVFAAKDGEWPVRQHGPRRLWDEVETAVYAFFDEANEPASTDWIVAVDTDGMSLQLPATRSTLLRPDEADYVALDALLAALGCTDEPQAPDYSTAARKSITAASLPSPAEPPRSASTGLTSRPQNWRCPRLSPRHHQSCRRCRSRLEPIRPEGHTTRTKGTTKNPRHGIRFFPACTDLL